MIQDIKRHTKVNEITVERIAEDMHILYDKYISRYNTSDNQHIIVDNPLFVTFVSDDDRNRLKKRLIDIDAQNIFNTLFAK